MQSLGQFRYLQPSIFSGLFDDPVVFVKARPAGRGILLDCGQLHHLAKRVLRSIDAIFISHAHMDHLMGFDHLLRHVHAASRVIGVYGPPGLAERIGHKLAGYDWNLTEKTWCSFAVYEVHAGRLEEYRFAGCRGFTAQHVGGRPRVDRTLLRTPHLTVEAEICDHGIPVLAFRVTEAQSFLIDKRKLAAQQLLPGPWIKALQQRFHGGDWGAEPLEVWREKAGKRCPEKVEDPQALYRGLCRQGRPASIGYVSDVGMTRDNLARIRELMEGVTLLVAECTFLAADREKARNSWHLCTSDLNLLCREIKPHTLVPVHLSKSYLGDPQRLYAELVPPPGTRILGLPAHLTPRPLLPDELPDPLPWS